MRNALHSAVGVTIALCLSILLLPAGTQALTLVNNGSSDYTIVIGNEASLSEHHAALELQKFIQMISGCYLPIKQDVQNPKPPMILVGNSKALASLSAGINCDAAGDEEFFIRTSGDNLILAGGSLRGSMYAVFTFLEEVLGCRWYSPECSYIPEAKTISFGALNIHQKPAFEYRDLDWYISRDADWSARNKVNSRGSELDPQHGGKVNYLSVHTFYYLMPPDRYYDDHPEYFSILSNRKRTWEFGQYCLTNPEVAKLMAREAIEWMKREPEGTIYSVSQNDWHVACTCPECVQVDEPEGSHAASLIYFVNEVARITEKTFPDKRIGTLAYTYTEIPPTKAQPRDNVVIRFAQIRGCDGHPLNQCEQNVKYRDYIREWGERGGTVYIWDYVTNYAHYVQPHPILWSIHQDILFFKEVGIDGVYLESNYQSEGAGFEDLQAWVESKLLWNPDQDLDALISDFMHGFYGPAAEPMKEYYYLLQDKTLNDWIHYRLYSPPTFGLFTPEVIRKADALFDEAMELAKNDVKAAYRVAEAQLGMRYVKLSLPYKHVVEGDWFKLCKDAPSYANLNELENFMETCDKHEIVHLSEGRGMNARYDLMRANVTDHRIITIENPDIAVQVIPSLGGRIFKMIHKKSGRDVLQPGNPETYGYPADGGYQESPAGIEIFDYELKESASGKTIVLDALLRNRSVENAFRYTREISIPASGAKVEINSTIEALGGGFGRGSRTGSPVSIRPSPGFTLGPTWQTKLAWADESGRFTFQELPEPNEDERRSQEFWMKNVPGNKWALYNAESGLGIINTFNIQELDVATVSVSGVNSVSMNLRTIQKPLREGDTISLHHSYEIVESLPMK